MPRPCPRFTARRLMVLVAVLSLPMALLAWFERAIRRALTAFYGPGGTLEGRSPRGGLGPAPAAGKGDPPGP